MSDTEEAVKSKTTTGRKPKTEEHVEREKAIITFLLKDSKKYFKAIQIAKGIELKRKTEVNPILYRMEEERMIKRKDESLPPWWKLRTKYRRAGKVAAATDISSKSKLIKKRETSESPLKEISPDAPADEVPSAAS
jgi:hypothetical protein